MVFHLLPLTSHDTIFLIQPNNGGFEAFDLLLVIILIAEDHNLIPHDSLSCRGSVEADGPRIPLSRNDIGLEALPVIEIGDHDLLIGKYPRLLN
jgi:hypothetical protein